MPSADRRIWSDGVVALRRSAEHIPGETWRMLREQWEASSEVDFPELERTFGIPAAAIEERARAERWRRRPQDERDRAQRALQRIVARHRAEWRAHAREYSFARLSSDPTLVLAARSIALVLELRQRCERAAWGLDQDQTPVMSVRINRTYLPAPLLESEQSRANGSLSSVGALN